MGLSSLSLALGIATSLGFFSLSAALLPTELGPYLRLSLAILFSVLSTLVVIKGFKRSHETKQSFPEALWLMLLALGAMADGIWIFSKQGWHLGGTGPYFRPPFNHDFVRNIGLIASLLRGGENPFLPGSALSYQVFWHQGAALLVGALNAWLKPLSLYELTAGVVLSYGFCFYWVLFSLLAEIKPKLIFNRVTGLAILLLLLSHAEIVNPVLSLIKFQRVGLEADWSAVQPLYFRFVSLKLIALCAPQHLFALLFVGIFYFIEWDFAAIKQKSKLNSSLFLFFAFLASPLIAVVGFIWAILGKSIFGPTPKFLEFLFSFLTLCFSAAVYSFLQKSSPLELFTTHRSEALVLFASNLSLWKQLPWELVAGLGILGIWVTILFFMPSSFKAESRRFLGGVGLMVLSLVLVNHGWSNPELRRHVSIVFCGLFPLFLLRLHPQTIAMNRLLMGTALIALIAHSFFLQAYLVKPSVLPKEVAWKDYFEMNRWMREQKFIGGVLAAFDASSGIEMPLPIEVATTWAGTPSALVHGNLSQEMRLRLEQIDKVGSILPYAKSLGYRYVVWGPLETKVWPERVRKRFIDGMSPIAQEGSVSLYTAHDNLLDALGSDPLSRAEKLREGYWITEAKVEYEKALALDPRNLQAKLGLGLCLKVLEEFPLAIKHFSEVAQAKPANVDVLADALFARGVVYSRLGKWYDALNDFTAVESYSPKFAGLENNIRVTKAHLKRH